MDYRNAEPTHAKELEIISRALAAARLYLSGTKPPDERWKLTNELLDDAQRACDAIFACRRRTLWDR